MGKQRNEPSDPAAELAEYDFSKSEGSSPENDGEESAELWPSSLAKNDATPKGQEVIETWVNSNYDTISRSNIRDFCRDADWAFETAQTWLYRAFPEQRDVNDLTKREKKAVIVQAAYGDEFGTTELTNLYDVSDPTLNFARNGVPDIVNNLREKHTKEKLREEADKLKIDDSENEDLQSAVLTMSEKEDIMRYFRENPNASVKTAKEKLGYDISPKHYGSFKGAVSTHNSKSQAGNNNDKSTDGGGITVTLQFEKEEARKIVLQQELSDEIKETVVERILEKVGL